VDGDNPQAMARLLAAAMELPEIVAALLASRGVGSVDEARRFLHPALDQLHSPIEMLGMRAAVERLERAIARREPMLIYGDYDVDGTMATVILKTAVELLGGQCGFHVPHRLLEGYGMRDEVVERAAAGGVSLIFSVDTGIRAFAAAETAERLGLDLIVTDHHLPQSEGVPRAVAVLNPNQVGCEYPCKGLCGAGVAFKVAQALLEKTGRQRLISSFLKIVAIATIADAVPLVDENRILVRHGLASLSRQPTLGVATLGIADTRGVPAAFCDTTIALPYNSAERVDDAFRAHPGRIAAAIVEPVVGNMGCVPPLPGYLQALREITARNGALLIFDEVMTGFRVAFGGAQQLYGIRPDLTTLGKVIGGGLPVGAYGGRKDIMSMVAPAGPIYQAGTLSGNPLAVAAGLATLRHLKAHPEIYPQIERRAAVLCAAAPADVTVNRVGSMFTFFFSDWPVTDWESAGKCDTQRFGRFFRGMLDRGIYLAPSQFEAAFLSAAHTEEDVRRTAAAAREVLAEV